MGTVLMCVFVYNYHAVHFSLHASRYLFVWFHHGFRQWAQQWALLFYINGVVARGKGVPPLCNVSAHCHPLPVYHSRRNGIQLHSRKNAFGVKVRISCTLL